MNFYQSSDESETKKSAWELIGTSGKKKTVTFWKTKPMLIQLCTFSNFTLFNVSLWLRTFQH